MRATMAGSVERAPSCGTKRERDEMSTSPSTCSRWRIAKSKARSGCCAATPEMMPELLVAPGSGVSASSRARRAVIHAVYLGEDAGDGLDQPRIGVGRGRIGEVERFGGRLVAGEAEAPIVGKEPELVDRRQPRIIALDVRQQGSGVERAIIA